MINAKKQRKTKEWEKSLQENQIYQGNISCKDELDKGQKWYEPKLRRGGKNTQKNCTKKILMTQIITKV